MLRYSQENISGNVGGAIPVMDTHENMIKRPTHAYGHTLRDKCTQCMLHTYTNVSYDKNLYIRIPHNSSEEGVQQIQHQSC